MAENLYQPQLRALRRARFLRDYRDFGALHRLTAQDMLEEATALQRDYASILLYGFHPHDEDTQAFIAEMRRRGTVTLHFGDLIPPPENPPPDFLLYDENDDFPLPQPYDLIISLYTLQSVNRLPQALSRYRVALRPGGVFFCALLDPLCLSPLRTTLQQAELAVNSGAARRFHPAIDVKDFGSLLSKVKFTAPVTAVQPVRFRYREPLDIVRDLRGIGENSLLSPTAPMISKKIFTAWRELAARHPAFAKDEEGYFSFTASFLSARAGGEKAS